MSKKSKINRREFLTSSIKTSVGLVGLSGVTWAADSKKIFGANDRVQVAVIGLHGQGFAHIKQFAKIPTVRVAAVCDVDAHVLDERIAQMTGSELSLPKPKRYVDIRKLLEDKDIDAISIATPNHWHSLMAIWACQAGKDVYVEKPCSHNWWEGRQLVRVANKYNRIVQHGCNSRSGAAVIEAMQKLREGLIGDVYLSRGLCYKWRKTIGRAKPANPPAYVNYDLWTGPAPLKQFTENRFHYNWHWIWDTGNGDIGNQGIHELDVARWGLGVKFPTKVSAIGGHVMFDDDQETPNTLNCAFEFKGENGNVKLLEFEVRHWLTNHEAEIGTGAFKGGDVPPPLGATAKKGEPRQADTIGNIFYGSKGVLAVNGYNSYKSWLGPSHEEGPSAVRAGNNWANFIEVVRSRDKSKLNAPIEDGHISCTLFHLANASYRVGRTIHFKPDTEEVIGDPEVARILRDEDRGYRNPYVIPENV